MPTLIHLYLIFCILYFTFYILHFSFLWHDEPQNQVDEAATEHGADGQQHPYETQYVCIPTKVLGHAATNAGNPFVVT